MMKDKDNKKKLNRRSFLRAGAVGAAGAALAACKPETIIQTVEVPGEDVIVKETVQVPADAKPNAFGYAEWHPESAVELEWWAHNPNDAAGPGANTRHIMEAFRAMYPKIDVQPSPSSWAAGATPLEKLAAAYAAGVGTPDVFLMYGASEEVVGNNWGYHVSEEMMPKEDIERLGYYENKLLLTSDGDDRTTEITSLQHFPLILYSVPAFEEAGVTADDLGTYFEDAIPALKELTKTDTDGTVLQAGFSFWHWLWPNFPVQAGSPYFNKETQKFEWTDDDAFKYACSFLRDLVQVHKITSPQIIFNEWNALADGLTAMTFNDSWMLRAYNVNFADADVRSRPMLRLKGGDYKGVRSKNYSAGVAVSKLLEDNDKLQSAFQFWKFTYYNTAMQIDLGFENLSIVTLKNAPDYKALFEGQGVPATGTLDRGQRIAEALYLGHEDNKDTSQWLYTGRLREQYPLFKGLLEGLVGTDRPIDELVEEYQGICQSDWDDNHWYVPGVIAA